MGSFWAHTRPYLICTRVYMLSVLTSSGYKCLFVVYAFFSWEASCYESCLVSHDVAIYCMLELADPCGRHYELRLSHPRHHSSWLLLHSWKALHDVAQQCHITRVCLRPLEVSSCYSSFWIISWTVVTCSSEQVSSFFSYRRLYAIFPTSQMHSLYG